MIKKALSIGVIALLFASQGVVAQNVAKVDKLRRLSHEYALRYEEQRTPLYYELASKTTGVWGRINASPDIALMGISPSGELIVYTVHNFNAAKSISTNQLWPGGTTGFNLTGSGTTTAQFAIWDGGAVRVSHQEFAAGRVVVQDGTTSLSDHATHVAGTMVAGGISSSAKGMSYEASLGSYYWDNDASEMASAAAGGLLVSNHSYGSILGWNYDGADWYWYGSTSVSETEDYRFGFYTSGSQTYDQIAYDAPNYTMVMSAGNDRNDDVPTPGDEHFVWNGSDWETSTTVRGADGGGDGYNSIGKSAKNPIVVAAVYDRPSGWTSAGTVTMSSFSGWGPTDDGRIKPDISANGVSLYSASSSADDAYVYKSGTSMSAPNLSGSINLLIQHYKAVNAGAIPTSSTIKALVINTANEAGATDGPDYAFGWGLANIKDAAELIDQDSGADELIFEDNLAQGQVGTYTITSAGDAPIRATIAWTDPAGTPTTISLNPADLMLVNDLDLRIFKVADDTEYEPWILDPNNPSNAATMGDNIRDNVEQVYIESPEAGDYRIEIRHKATLTDGPQSYSLVVSQSAPQQEVTDDVAVSLTATSNAGYQDQNNIAGYRNGAGNGYDSEDVPEPPDPGNNYISAYWYESGFTGYEQNLTEDWHDLGSVGLAAETKVFPLKVVTDDASGDFTLTFDHTYNHGGLTGGGVGAVLWDPSANAGNGAFQNLDPANAGGSETYTFTPVASTIYDFALLLGNQNAPSISWVAPTERVFPRVGGNTINFDVDDLNPFRRIFMEFSNGTEPDAGAEGANRTFTTLSAGGFSLNPADYDDPTDGITNLNLLYSWAPHVSHAGLVAQDDLFPNAQLKVWGEDWAGNVGNPFYIDVEITDDQFNFDADYSDGWHLISFPMEPRQELPEDVFTGAEGNGNGIKGPFDLLKYDAVSGTTAVVDVNIGRAYWLVLDEANTTVAGHKGLGIVEGILPEDAEAVTVNLSKNGAWNHVGTTVRADELGDGKTYRITDWEISVDGGSTWLSWADAATAGHVAEDGVVGYDNAGEDYTTGLEADVYNLEPGRGYSFQVLTNGGGDYKWRTVRNTVNATIAPPSEGGNGAIRELNDLEAGIWAVPVAVSLNGMYSAFTMFGTHPDATDGYDSQFDFSAPPVPPTNNYVRIFHDHQEWQAIAGRFFVRDIRDPFTFEDSEATWNFMLYATQTGPVTIAFDASIFEGIDVSEGFTATAEVGGQTYDLTQSQIISFDYEGGQVPVVIRAAMDWTKINESAEAALPERYAIESAYPNPFNPSTVVRIGLPEAASLKVRVFNVLGREVAVLGEGDYRAGYHDFVFSAGNLASGMYFVQAEVPGKLDQVKKVMLMR